MPTISYVVGKKIREVRNDLGLSMESCAERAGISTTFLGDIERGQKEPSLGTLQKLSVALGLSLREIVAEIETRVDGVSKFELLSRLKPLWRERYSEIEAEAICQAVAHPTARS